MAADLVQGYEDGGFNVGAVVQEGPCDCLDSLLFCRWEKRCGRLLGGPLLCSLAVNGCYSVMWGMLWEFWRFVVEFIEGLFHVARRGYVGITFGIVPGKGEATVLFPFPIN